MDIVTQFVAGRPLGRLADIFAISVGIVCCFVLIVFGAKLAAESYAKGIYDFFKLREVAIWPFYAVLTFGSTLWLLQLAREAYCRLRAPRRSGTD